MKNIEVMYRRQITSVLHNDWEFVKLNAWEYKNIEVKEWLHFHDTGKLLSERTKKNKYIFGK